VYYILLPIGYSVQWRVGLCRPSIQCPPYALYVVYRAAANGDRLQQLAAAVAVLRVFELLHSCTFRVNPHFDLESDYIVRKPIVHRI